MGKLNLHITNANQQFSDAECILIRNATNDAQNFVSKCFTQFDYEVDIVVTAPSQLMPVIPEDKISARTYSSQLIVIVVDNLKSSVREDFVYEILCHEMSHSLRWEKLPEYANTMFEGFILEGLAIVLEDKAINDSSRKSSQFFLQEMKRTDESMVKSMIENLKGSFADEKYDYEKVFYTGDDSIPRWTGYRLGYYFVNEYLNQSNTTIQEATLASYKNFKSE